MEHEEREEIPWSNLVAHVEEGSDRRWYIVAVAVGIVVVAFVGLRFLGTTSGGVEPADIGAPTSSTTTTVAETSPSEGALIVAEEELTTEAEVGTMHVVTRAEWFVADFFTVDGSDATEADLRAALGDDLTDVDLPHGDEAMPETFVEWAKAIAVRDLQPSSFEVDVAYRAITASEGGYERSAVTFVTVGVTMSDGVPLVDMLPVPTDPWTE